MNKYEIKIQSRKERLIARAEKMRKEGEQRVKRAKEISDFIPLGQPILIGHHSERRHRNDIQKIQSNYEKGYKLQDDAGKLEERAEYLGEYNISSDDPDAIAKLEKKLSTLEAWHENKKKANKFFKTETREDVKARYLAELAFTVKEIDWVVYRMPKCGCGTLFGLANSSAEIRRIKDRIETLKIKQTFVRKEIDFKFFTVVENVDENRLQLIFKEKPEYSTRDLLKKNGFKWSPTNAAWQRQLTQNARNAVYDTLAELKKQKLLEDGK